MRKNIFFILLIIFITILQTNFINFLGSLFRYFNLLLFTIIIISVFYQLKYSLILAIVAGYLTDLYSIKNFGVHIFAFVFSIVLIHYFFKKYITNKSLYSFIILMLFGTLFYHSFIIITDAILFYSGFSEYKIILNFNLFLDIFIQLISHALIALLVYFFINFITNRLNANFIIKRGY